MSFAMCSECEKWTIVGRPNQDRAGTVKRCLHSTCYGQGKSWTYYHASDELRCGTEHRKRLHPTLCTKLIAPTIVCSEKVFDEAMVGVKTVDYPRSYLHGVLCQEHLDQKLQEIEKSDARYIRLFS